MYKIGWFNWNGKKIYFLQRKACNFRIDFLGITIQRQSTQKINIYPWPERSFILYCKFSTSFFGLFRICKTETAIPIGLKHQMWSLEVDPQTKKYDWAPYAEFFRDLSSTSKVICYAGRIQISSTTFVPMLPITFELFHSSDTDAIMFKIQTSD